MDKVGVLVVSKCLSASAILDTFARSQKYQPEFYVVERKANPFNLGKATVHKIIPDLNIEDVTRFASRYRRRIAFGMTDTEDFVVGGGRDLVEKEARVPMVCVSGKYAVERSKAEQRALFEEICPGVNPQYKVFDPEKFASVSAALDDLKKFAELVDGVVIKPDKPARGAGVGVWGKDFGGKEMKTFFEHAYASGKVVVEEKLDGEESSFHAFSDGRHFVPVPLTRDYKRALDGDGGRLTGGMGSYRDVDNLLPFLPQSEWEKVVGVESAAFRKWKGRGPQEGLRGIVLYDALMHTKKGFKILERNSRGGNTEQINLLTTIDDDLFDICFRILDGSLKNVRFRRRASVVTCLVPNGYGGSGESPPSRAEIRLGRAMELERVMKEEVRVLPMDAEMDGGRTYLGSSRSVAVVGVGERIEEAREHSLLAADLVDGPVWHRTDIASSKSISKSRRRLASLRAYETPYA